MANAVDVVPAAPAAPAASAEVWLRALRLYSITASVVPVVFGGLLAWPRRDAAGPWLWPLAVLGAVLLHLGTNLLNDHGDFASGVDRPGTSAGSGVLVEGLLTPRQVARAAALCFGLAVAVGLVLARARGWSLVALGVTGVLGGWAYTAGPRYKYVGLGDPFVFLLMGPLMSSGAALVVGGVLSWTPALAALPLGLLVTAILHANNLRDLEDDRASGVRTLAIALGRRGSVAYLAVLLGGAYVALAALAVSGAVPAAALAAVASAPLAWSLARDAARSVTLEARRAAHLVERAAQLHLAFGALCVAGVALALVFGAVPRP